MATKPRANTSVTVAQTLTGDVLDPHDPAIEGEHREIVAQHAPELNAGALGPAGGDAVIDEDASDSLLRVLSELGDDAGQARVIVSRAAKDPREKPAYICSWYASEFSLDQLGAGYGGGTYLYRVITPGGQLITRGKVSIEEPRNAAVLKSIAATHEPAPDTATAIANALLTALKPLLERPQKTTADVLAELKTMKEVFAPAPGPAVESQSLTQKLKEMLELQTLLKGLAGVGGSRGGDGGGDSFAPIMVKMIEQFGPVFADKLKAAATAAPAAVVDPNAPPALPPPAQPVQPVAAGENLQPEKPAAPNAAPPAENVDMSLMLKFALMDLASQAAANKDTHLYGAVVYDRIPDDKTVIDICTRADWWEFLCNINNDIRPFQAWFTALRDEIVRLAKEDGLLNADGTAAPVQP